MIKNPILPGFHPDPSICRAGDDYYLVTSTFEYFPGIPIYHSRDLVSWEQIGNVLDRAEQLNLDDAASSGGLYAPSIRYHNGIFYAICTNTSHGGNFVVTAKDPRGPWSNPYFLNTDGIDPSLFFDDDGKAYYVGQRQKKSPKYGGDCEIYLQAFDTERLQVTGEPVAVWDGALKNAFWAEGPRVYKAFGYYYLLIAEGGTRDYHSVTMARSKSIFGEYQPCGRHPIVTNRHLGSDYPIVNVGHADLIETQNGEWWMVALGSRNIEGRYSNLGRETFLAKVDWDTDLWPVVNKSVGHMPEVLDFTPDLPPTPVKERPALERFHGTVLPPHWITARTPRNDFYSLTGSSLRLYAQKTCAKDTKHFSFWGQRARHKNFVVKTVLSLKNTSCGEKAGLVILQKNTHFFEMAYDGQSIGLWIRNGEEYKAVQKQCALEKIYLTVKVIGQRYHFYYGKDETETLVLAEGIDGRILSQEHAKSYTGLVVGMFASSYGKETRAYADFDSFYYAGNDASAVCEN